MSDPGLGVPRSLAAGTELPDGRGFLDARTEMQVAVVSADPAGAAQAAAIAQVGTRLRQAGVTPAEPLAELPEDLAREALPSVGEPLRPVLGLADLSRAPVTVDLSRSNLVVCGPPLSGRSTVLETVAWSLRAAAAGPDRPQLVAIGSVASALADAGLWDRRGFGRNQVGATLEEASAMVEGDDGTTVRLVLFVDAAEDVDSPQHAARLEALVRSDAVRVVAVVDPATLARTFSGWLAELKTNRSMLVLRPASATEVEAVAGRRPALRPDQPFPPGRGVLVDRVGTQLVHVAGP